MRKIRSVAVVISLVVAGVMSGRGVASAAGLPATYYLALGDSLSRGYMPGPGNTDHGYVDDLFATLHARDSALQLVKLGCSGETTTTMRTGGICSYGTAGSQLRAAEQFLRAHHGSVTYLTLDIGANDVQDCVGATGIDTACVTAGLATIGTNLPAILSGLRRAGSGQATVAAMTYYDPFLAAWLTGPTGQAQARQSAQITHVLNRLESDTYADFGIRVARVGHAFKTQDFTTTTTLPGVGTVPVNVATICTLTYMCSRSNIHPNVAGYTLIAQTFAAILAGCDPR